MAVAVPDGAAWRVRVQAVGALPGLLGRLLDEAGGAGVALGIDCPLGVPRGYAAAHLAETDDFPAFLRGLAGRPGVFDVAATLEEVGAGRPFYPRRGARGMTRLSHALALGLGSAAALSRACDRATAERPAGAPVFWTLGANQSGKAAISAWRDVLLPGWAAGTPIRLWPFEGPLLSLLGPGAVAIAETYPADALRQLGLRPVGSKRRQADRAKLEGGLRGAMRRLQAAAEPGLDALLGDGFGPEAAGEDKLDCVLGVLCVLSVLAGARPDTAPADPWVQRWEGWVLGQA